LIGVDILDECDSAQAFMRQYGWTSPTVNDPGASIRDGYGLLGQPITSFYDASRARADACDGSAVTKMRSVPTSTRPSDPDPYQAKEGKGKSSVQAVISRRAIISASRGAAPFGGTYSVESPVTPASASSRTTHRSIIGRPTGNGVASYTTSSCSAP